jgi:hypothetical protein
MKAAQMLGISYYEAADVPDADLAKAWCAWCAERNAEMRLRARGLP